MKDFYVFTNSKFFAHFNTNGTAAELKNSIAINNGFDPSEVVITENIEGFSVDEIQAEMNLEKESLEFTVEAVNVINQPEYSTLITEYNDQDTEGENQHPEYVKTVLRSYPLVTVA